MVDVICGGSMRRTPRRRCLLAAAVVAASLLAAPGVAQAQSSGVDQYVEDVPTGGGKAHPGVTPPERTELPAQLTTEIAAEGGSDAPLLTEVASSATYGAPQTRPKARAKTENELEEWRDAEASVGAAEDVDGSAALSAAASAVQGGDTGRLAGLLVALFVISLAALGAAVFRYRRRDSA